MAKRNRQDAGDESVAGSVGIPPQPAAVEVGKREEEGEREEARGKREPEARAPVPDGLPAHAMVEIVVPMAGLDPNAHLSRHVEAQLTPEQAVILRGVQNALNQRYARMANGKFVQSGADAVRWLLEQVACRQAASSAELQGKA